MRQHLVVLAVLLWGCGISRQKELENVAKDWCLAIRASQVIPVYPMSEDVQPGDVFLVQRTIHEQAKQYSERGYLPLDQMITRLDGLDYPAFYGPSFWKGDYAGTPHPRPAPQGDKPVGAGGAKPSTSRFPGAPVPRAAFPSYNFETSRGAGLSLAVPVQGVPLGLSLMGTDKASGSITISDAFTYGIDGEELLRKLEDWAGGDMRKELARIGESTSKPLFLRVITRVYLTGAVTVSLTNQAAQSAGLDAGAPKPVGILDLSKPQEMDKAATDYKNALEKISGVLNEGLPGGSIRLAAASNRSVSLREDFDRPLVIGYLAFDVQVLKDGRLGPLIATQSMLEATTTEAPSESAPGSELRSLATVRLVNVFLLLRGADDAKSKLLVTDLNGLRALVPDKYPVPIYTRTETRAVEELHKKDSESPKIEDFRRVTTYSEKLNYSIRALEQPGGAALSDAQRKDLAATLDELARLTASLRRHRTVLEAVDHAARIR